ncbi:MAG TPA: hypothetical protein VFZ78_13790 [Flavisolibacter sp.]
MRYLFFLLLLVSASAQAQLKSYELTSKGDTLNRLDVRGIKHGPWVEKFPELRGERGYEEEGYYVQNRREGVWKRFSPEGDLLAIESYRFGMKHGKCVYFTNAGEPLREEMWRAIDPENPYDTVNVYDVDDPTRIVRKEIIKVEPMSYKHGTWTFLDPMTGTVVKTEKWVMNREKVEGDATSAAGDDMAPIDVASGNTSEKKEEKKQVTKPKEVLEFEKKNSGKKKIKVRDGSTGG